MDSNMTYSASGVYGLLTDCRAMMEYGRSQPAQGYSHESTVHEDVKEYYGKILRKTADLKSNACMTVAKPMTSDIRNALKEVHPDVSDRYYGCGLAVPESLQGCRVLDLGCGSGRDCYMLSRLVGERGFVTGVDMTDEQLQVARKYIDYHTQRFGYRKPNTEFVQGYIEDLEDAGLKEGFYDIIISNCVVNLSPDKTSVLKQAHHVLKDGGELYFSDIYCNKDLPAEIRTHKVLWGECLGGALFWEDLMRLAGEVGFSTPRLVTASAVTVGDEELENLLEGYAERQAASRVKVSKTAVHKNKVKQETLETTSNQPGEYKFVSATYRLFKIPRSAPNIACLVIYNGNITGFEDSLNFDSYHTFKVNAVVPVDGELASILKTSRFAEEFSFQPCLADQPSSLCMGPKTVSWNPFEVENLEASRPCCGASKSCCK